MAKQNRQPKIKLDNTCPPDKIYYTANLDTITCHPINQAIAKLRAEQLRDMTKERG